MSARVALGVCALGLFVGSSVSAQGPRAAAPAGVRILQVRPNVYMILSEGGNITVQTGRQGVLLVDTPVPAAAPQVLAAIRTLSPAPIRYIINTSADRDHAGGNEAVARTSAPPVGAILGRTQVAAIGTAAGMTILAHEQVLNRLTAAPSGGDVATPQGGLPTLEYFQPTKDLSMNGEAIIVYHAPAAHTDGDSIVLFRGSDVVSTGDLFSTDRYPAIDRQRGGTVDGVIAGLNLVLSLTVPEAFQEGGTKVIPGHGRLSEENDVAEYRDMVAIVRDRVQDLVRKGQTLAQVKAQRPTRDYDGEYASPAVTPDQFVEAIYAGLAGRK